ncbi:hypothetical protein GW17_00033414 [Ensete ventricosum]|nr:hypothetical protein GW17_00033414 [Ensete ventricosum]
MVVVFRVSLRLTIMVALRSTIALCSCLKLITFEISSSVDAVTNAVGSTISLDPQIMVEYLVNSCGFSPIEAAKVSKPIMHLRSIEKSVVILNFMISQGLDGATIKKVISLKPIYLCCNVETNLISKFHLT